MFSRMVRLALGVPLAGGRRAALVGGQEVQALDLGQVGADLLGVGRRRVHVFAVCLPRLDEQDRGALEDRVADLQGDLTHDAGGLAVDHVLHLEGFHDRHRLARQHHVALGHGIADHHALHGRGHRQRALRPGREVSPRPGVGRLVCARRGTGLQVQQRQRIHRVDPGARPALLRAGRLEVTGPVPGGGQQLGGVLLDVPGVQLTRGQGRALQQGLQEGDVGPHPADLELAQRPASPGRGGGQVVGRDDHLGQQRVVARRGRVAGVPESVDAHARPGGLVIGREHAAARPGRAVGGHRLQVHPRLQGHAPRGRHAVLRQPEAAQVRAVGDAELDGHQIAAQHRLGDGVLDLQPGVGLDEGEPGGRAGAGVDQELDGADPAVAHRRAERHRRVQHPGPHRLGQAEGRGDLDQLLALALQAALAVPQVRDRARPVSDDLHLDVPGPGQQLFHIQLARAEGAAGLRRGPREGLVEVGQARHRPHAPPASAGHGLEHDGPARPQAGQEVPRLLQGHRGADAREHRHAAALGQHPRRGLVAEDLQGFGGGPDEGQPGLLAGGRERAVLAQETVARVNGVAPCGLSGGDNGGPVEIGRHSRRREGDRPVRRPRVQTGRVVFGVDRYGLHAEVPGGPRDPHGDLAPVGDQQAFRHQA